MFTWVDILIILVVAVYALDGYRQGFIKILLDILTVVVSLFLALKFYPAVADIFLAWGVNATLAKPMGFLALWSLAQIIFYLLELLIFHYFPQYHPNRTAKIIGIFPGMIKGLMIVAIFLIILVTLPLSTSFKNNLASSFISGNIVKSTARVETQMSRIFGQLNNSLTFLSIAPADEEEMIRLDFHTNDFSIDTSGEDQMLILVNNERAKVGLPPLKADILLRNVARAHSMDMLRNGYFSHKSPSGVTPFDRLTAAGAVFHSVGENLALAPSVELANIGLMNSPSHRDNILDKNYTKVGIGVINAGPYGEMITQEFTD